VFCKGAPEIVLDLCDSYLKDGKEVELTDDKKDYLLKEVIKNFA